MRLIQIDNKEKSDDEDATQMSLTPLDALTSKVFTIANISLVILSASCSELILIKIQKWRYATQQCFGFRAPRSNFSLFDDLWLVAKGNKADAFPHTEKNMKKNHPPRQYIRWIRNENKNIKTFRNNFSRMRVRFAPRELLNAESRK